MNTHTEMSIWILSSYLCALPFRVLLRWWMLYLELLHPHLIFYLFLPNLYSTLLPTYSTLRWWFVAWEQCCISILLFIASSYLHRFYSSSSCLVSQTMHACDMIGCMTCLAFMNVYCVNLIPPFTSIDHMECCSHCHDSHWDLTPMICHMERTATCKTRWGIVGWWWWGGWRCKQFLTAVWSAWTACYGVLSYHIVPSSHIRPAEAVHDMSLPLTPLLMSPCFTWREMNAASVSSTTTYTTCPLTLIWKDVHSCIRHEPWRVVYDSQRSMCVLEGVLIRFDCCTYHCRCITENRLRQWCLPLFCCRAVARYHIHVINTLWCMNEHSLDIDRVIVHSFPTSPFHPSIFSLIVNCSFRSRVTPTIILVSKVIWSCVHDRSVWFKVLYPLLVPQNATRRVIG